MIESGEKMLDKSFRTTTFYKIRDKDSKLVLFQPNEAQVHFAQNRSLRNIILKSRKLGFTTAACVDMLDNVLFTRNFEAILISYSQPTAIKLFNDMIHFAWLHFPEELKQLYIVDASSANQLRFDLGNGNISGISVALGARSGTYNHLHISEMGKICAESPDKEAEIFAGAIPSVPIGGRIDIESTAEGDEGAFHDLFWSAWNRGNPRNPLEYKAHFYNWRWDKREISKVKDYEVGDIPRDFLDIQRKYELTDTETKYYYLRWQELKKNWTLLFQEYPTTPEEAFSYSKDLLFSKEILKYQQTTEGERFNDWTYYKPYKASHRYALGADVAEGINRDSSTCVIIDFSTQPYEVVATYRSTNVPPDQFAWEIRNGANKYGNPLVAVERNSCGWATLTKLKDIYHNIYYEHDIRGQRTKTQGWHTTGHTKPKMLHELNDAINEQAININSKELLQELLTYNKEDIKESRVTERTTKHWDLLMAFAIAYQMLPYAHSSLQAKTTVYLEPFHV